MTQLMREAVEALKKAEAHLRRCEYAQCAARIDNALSHLTEELRRQESAPEFDRDTDGELLIDWSPSKDRMLTLSLRADGRLSYAFTWDGEKAHGTAQTPAAAAQALHTDQTALDRFNECGGAEEPDPLERLRFFCSLAMKGQDWLDVEPFFAACKKKAKDKRRAPDASVEADRGGEHGVQDEAQALDLLDKLFTAYLDSVDVPEDQKEQAGHLGHAMKLDDETFYACANLLNRTRPQDRGGER